MVTGGGRLRQHEAQLETTNADCPLKNPEDSTEDREQDTGPRKGFCFIVFQEASDCPVLPNGEKGAGRLKKSERGDAAE